MFEQYVNSVKPAVSCSNSFLGTRQMLMHEKTCVIPITDIIDKNRYLSEAGRGNRSPISHPFKYHRPNAYTDRLKFSFFPRTTAT